MLAIRHPFIAHLLYTYRIVSCRTRILVNTVLMTRAAFAQHKFKYP